MINKCLGCGAVFQFKDPLKEGYVTAKNFDKAKVCRRCFRIKNYGDYQYVNKDKTCYQAIFDEIKSKEELVLFLCDIFTLDDSVKELNKFKGKVILVITKTDLLPKSVKEGKLLSYVKKNYELNFVSVLFVNSNKRYNLDVLINEIKRHKVSNNVYLVGNTNAGKSTLINALISSYSNESSYVTTSVLPATTLDVIEIKLNDEITLIDTPGIVCEDNYLTNADAKTVKNVSCKSEIRPRTYQMKPRQSLIIGDYARIDYLQDTSNSFTLYLSNDIKVKRINLDTNDYLRNLKLTQVNLKKREDVVISGLCFCKITNKALVNVYVKEGVKVFKRESLI